MSRSTYCRIRVQSAVPARYQRYRAAEVVDGRQSGGAQCAADGQQAEPRWPTCGNASMQFLVARCSWAARRRPNSTSTKRHGSQNLIIPVVLAVIFVILILLLQAWWHHCC